MLTLTNRPIMQYLFKRITVTQFASKQQQNLVEAPEQTAFR